MSAVAPIVSPIIKEKKLKINLKRIKSARTLEYLKKNALADISDLDKIVPLCYLEGIENDFLKHSKSYKLPYSVDDVWDAYINIPPAESWAGNRIGFSFSYNTDSKDFHYLHDQYHGLEVNQLIFIEIKLLFGLFKLAVTHHVNQISPEEKKIKLCYVEGGKSSGSQIITFKKISESESIVVHDTFYKSDSKFRDEKLYPFLHELIINQFHKNVRKYMDR
ncbi:hypothetical protein [Jiulongibacter sediminis]|uniref:Uncharacterized protein n=1 Tax=Jiulongibacter sediminis TaxID=1605367 RepID=A0A0P7BSX3_9BACT|nr:hypothetical protein [Jiulongibacter sediminis]KPM48024.1 hypothetical protein AFM12_12530 [Jiulongibacter sediminis]TBX24204.1 hypothetical protein TK44_12540 [Jiulongibacter sediminis]